MREVRVRRVLRLVCACALLVVVLVAPSSCKNGAPGLDARLVRSAVFVRPAAGPNDHVLALEVPADEPIVARDVVAGSSRLLERSARAALGDTVTWT